MKQTNDKAVFRLVHMPTGREVDWVMSRFAVPAVNYIEDRIDKVREEYLTWMEKQGIDLKKNQDLSSDDALKVHEYTQKIIQLKMDAVSCVLDLHSKESLPDDYANKREYLEDCMGELSIINEILTFFLEHYGNTISQQGQSRQLLQILDQKGNPWPSNDMKQSEEKTSSID